MKMPFTKFFTYYAHSSALVDEPAVAPESQSRPVFDQRCTPVQSQERPELTAPAGLAMATWSERASNLAWNHLARRMPEAPLSSSESLGRGVRGGNPLAKGFPAGIALLCKLLMCVMALVVVVTVVPVQAKLVIPLNDPNMAKMPVAIPDFVTPPDCPVSGRDLADILRNDLLLTGLFAIVPAPQRPATGPDGQPDFDAWAQQGVQALVLGSVQVQGMSWFWRPDCTMWPSRRWNWENDSGLASETIGR